MISGFTVTKSFHFSTGRNSRQELQSGNAPPKSAPGRIPRIARLMALAIRFDELVRARDVVDQADLARLGRVSRARVSQIMNLTLLAPDIQEELLFLPRVEQGRDPIHLRMLQPIARERKWSHQRNRWRELKALIPT
jgi:hypothetical protein